MHSDGVSNYVFFKNGIVWHVFESMM